MFNKKIQKRIIFLIIFALIGFVVMQIPFVQLVGSKVKFTLFDFFGPMAGAFLGSVWGVAAVALMQLGNWAIHGFALDAGTIIRFFPMLFAVWYFARKSNITLAVPVIAMIAFWAHPEGRVAWPFALLWLIPIVAHFGRERFLIFRALGATFTAHSVGGALWIWVFNLKAAVWMGLIPVVLIERGLFAVGIAVSYVVTNVVLNFAVKKNWFKLDFVKLNKKYGFASR
jgi:hypothetical protein